MNKSKGSLLWLLPLLLLLVPTMYAMVVGFWVIYKDWNLIFILLALGISCSLVSWLLGVWWVRRRLRLLDVRLKEREYWSHLERLAAAEVEKYARQTDVDTLDMSQTQSFLPHFLEILHRVAGVYHPEKKSPELDIPVADVLMIAQRVAEDMREFISENIPGAHLLTLHDIRYIQNAVRWSRPAYNAYRVISVPISPLSAFFRETRSYFTRKFTESVIGSARESLIHFAFCQVGFYAVELYSGRMRMEYLREAGQWLPPSHKNGDLDNLKENRAGGASVAEEPLRVLVAGQPKSGKTSLIRSLFSLETAMPDPVSRENGIARYLVEAEGQQVLISDAPGYDLQNLAEKKSFLGTSADPLPPFPWLKDETQHADIIFLVCDLNTAAREADRLFVDGLRAWAEENPGRDHPLLVVVMTGIDRLRPFLEWNPPFNLTQPATEKERNIHEASETLAAALDLDQSIPVVAVCLNPERVYNVRETLRPILADVFTSARCVRDSRLLAGLGRGRRWRETGKQLSDLGGRIWKHLWQDRGRK